MTPERWQQISQIFKSAISLDNDARRKFVAEKCGDDDSLRSEVEKLIASHQQASAENFIGGHAAEQNAALLSVAEEYAPALNKGQQFGSYFILDPLGAGGMGEVYLARDSRLDRTVALKVLSADVSSDKRRMQRFRQEARVASSLNQPNILTIFEFGEANGLTYLATEFIDGETLRDYLRGKRLKLPEILDITIQILAALDAAHEARIVHRDIKPENVMIRRRDRVVKVLDFGLAKVTERQPTLAKDHNSDSEAATEMKTAPGMLMGTINYMSPEQAQSHAVDERTDIWSTGVMLYEMITGAMPFGGPTVSHTLVQIIENDPPPLAKAAAQTPPELQRIVKKAMAKDADDRYQTAKDMLIDLRNLRKQLEGGPAVVDDRDRGAEKRRALGLAFLVLAFFVATTIAVNIWRRSRAPSAVPPTVISMTAGPERTLTYWITVQPFRNGKYQQPYTLSGEVNFEQQDQLRLNLRSPQDGHLYIINEAPRAGFAPDYVVLFPTPSTNDNNSFVRAGQELRFPDKTWLRFDNQQGVERLWLVFSEDPLPQLEGLKGLVTHETRGHVTDDVQTKTIREFVEANSTVKASLDKSDTLTTLKAPGKLLLYPVKLEHH
ncbi:MAG TPA: protein kinase [Pyrinomonadaceae bacterium]